MQRKQEAYQNIFSDLTKSMKGQTLKNQEIQQCTITGVSNQTRSLRLIPKADSVEAGCIEAG